jgi:hypothetical protein
LANSRRYVMAAVLEALKDFPIPTILVIAGIAFLLLSIAGQLAGRIAVPPERQRQAAIIGSILLVSGVALFIVPPARLIPPTLPEVLPPGSGTPPEPATKDKPPPPSSAGSPGTQQAPIIEGVQIPWLNARITALRFFEGDPCKEPPLEERLHRQRFAKVVTRDVFTEITLEYPKPEQRLNFTITAIYRYTTPQDGRNVSKPKLDTYLPADSQRSIHTFRSHEGGLQWCSPFIRKWSVGSYTVDVYIHGDKMASGSFEIYD